MGTGDIYFKIWIHKTLWLSYPGKSEKRERDRYKDDWVNNNALYWGKEQWWGAVDGWGVGKNEKFNCGHVNIKSVYMSPKNRNTTT